MPRFIGGLGHAIFPGSNTCGVSMADPKVSWGSKAPDQLIIKLVLFYSALAIQSISDASWCIFMRVHANAVKWCNYGKENHSGCTIMALSIKSNHAIKRTAMTFDPSMKICAAQEQESSHSSYRSHQIWKMVHIRVFVSELRDWASADVTLPRLRRDFPYHRHLSGIVYH